ncbi:MAG: dimethylsulfonioproprionate lyase family protein [Actinomycetota bacterium]
MIDELLARIAAFHRSRTPSPEFPMVAEVLDALDTVSAPDEIPAAPPLTVTRHLSGIEPTGTDPGVDAVLEEFLRIAPHLPWRRTAGYLDVLSEEYLANYGYVQLVGPAPSVIEHPTVRVGIGVWGPDLHYPLHEHEAEELYHVLAGEPAFGTEDGHWVRSTPGDAVHNPPWHRHAQRFGSAPTVLLYCWTGAVEADAVLIEAP